LGRAHLGVGAPAILLAAGLLMAASVALAVLPIAGLAPPPSLSLAATNEALRRHRVAFGIAAASALIVGGVLRLSAWHLGPDGYISGGWNWSDLLVHVSIASSLQHGNFP